MATEQDDRFAGRQGPWRRLVGRLTATAEDAEADELQEGSRGLGCTAIARCQPGGIMTVSGTLRAVTLQPRAGSPALEAELYDGSGRVTLVWIGRRRIAGIEPGRSLKAVGRVTGVPGELTLYNPRYTLLATGAE
ncbi:MAG: DNA-binding protein [Actinomycetota bacterium]|nr:MAG: DNA-binding protein [Actinomycetota bacterium]